MRITGHESARNESCFGELATLLDASDQALSVSGRVEEVRPQDPAGSVGPETFGVRIAATVDKSGRAKVNSPWRRRELTY
jgi:hypothetical protein